MKDDGKAKETQIKGLLLLVNGSLGSLDGCQLVFHMPASITVDSGTDAKPTAVDKLQQNISTPTTPQSTHHTQQHPADKGIRRGSAVNQGAGAGGAASNVGDAKKRNTTNAFGYPTSFLAKLLTPKASLCNDIFDITVDNLRFICFPHVVKPSLIHQHNKRLLEQLQDQQQQRQEEMDTSNPNGFVNGAWDWQDGWSDTFPPPEVLNNPVRGVAVPANRGGLSVINVVLVLQHDSPLGEECKDIVRKICGALQHEEERQGFVSAQVTRMLEIRDHMSRLQTIGSNNNTIDPKSVHAQQLNCSLASNFKNIFDGLTTHGYASVRINNWVSVSVRLQQPKRSLQGPKSTPENSIPAFASVHAAAETASDGKKNQKSEPIQQLEWECVPWRLKSYHTAILLQHPDSILASLPRDTNPAFERLVVSCSNSSGLKNFRDIFLETGIDLGTIYAMVCHLATWGRAIVMQTIVRTHTYTLRPTLPPIHPGSMLDHSFYHKFPSCKAALALVLGTYFAAPTSVDDLKHEMPPKDAHTLVAWLLSHGLIQPLLSYVQLVGPDGTAPTQQIAAQNAAIDALGALALPKDEHRQVLANLERVRHLLDGLHHVDEIITEGGISRNDINLLTQHFDNIVIKSWHPQTLN